MVAATPSSSFASLKRSIAASRCLAASSSAPVAARTRPMFSCAAPPCVEVELVGERQHLTEGQDCVAGPPCEPERRAEVLERVDALAEEAAPDQLEAPLVELARSRASVARLRGVAGLDVRQTCADPLAGDLPVLGDPGQVSVVPRRLPLMRHPLGNAGVVALLAVAVGAPLDRPALVVVHEDVLVRAREPRVQELDDVATAGEGGQGRGDGEHVLGARAIPDLGAARPEAPQGRGRHRSRRCCPSRPPAREARAPLGSARRGACSRLP